MSYMSVWYAGSWRTPEGVERHKASKRRSAQSPEGRKVVAARNARKVRIRAGGVQFYLGHAPTAEAAHHLRRKIREEGPRGSVQQS